MGFFAEYALLQEENFALPGNKQKRSPQGVSYFAI